MHTDLLRVRDLIGELRDNAPTWAEDMTPEERVIACESIQAGRELVDVLDAIADSREGPAIGMRVLVGCLHVLLNAFERQLDCEEA